jgi:hypothetical protein
MIYAIKYVYVYVLPTGTLHRQTQFHSCDYVGAIY